MTLIGGETVAKGDSWDFGIGAGFYLNATQQPVCYALHPFTSLLDVIVKCWFETVCYQLSNVRLYYQRITSFSPIRITC
jgi:hypothetical protein